MGIMFDANMAHPDYATTTNSILHSDQQKYRPRRKRINDQHASMNNTHIAETILENNVDSDDGDRYHLKNQNYEHYDSSTGGAGTGVRRSIVHY